MKLKRLLIPQEGSALAESAITKPPEMAGGGGATLILLRAAEAHVLLGADPRWMTWITGRPGNGKAALAERVAEAVAARRIPAVMVGASAPRRVCREAARELIPSLAEVQEFCPAGIFMARERGAFERLLSELSARLEDQVNGPRPLITPLCPSDANGRPARNVLEEAGPIDTEELPDSLKPPLDLGIDIAQRGRDQRTGRVAGVARW